MVSTGPLAPFLMGGYAPFRVGSTLGYSARVLRAEAKAARKIITSKITKEAKDGASGAYLPNERRPISGLLSEPQVDQRIAVADINGNIRLGRGNVNPCGSQGFRGVIRIPYQGSGKLTIRKNTDSSLANRAIRNKDRIKYIYCQFA